MAVVIDEFEATGEAPRDAKADGGKPAAPRPHETRKHLRAVALRAARVWAHG